MAGGSKIVIAERRRTVFELIFKGLSYREIAKQLNCNFSTIQRDRIAISKELYKDDFIARQAGEILAEFNFEQRLRIRHRWAMISKVLKKEGKMVTELVVGLKDGKKILKEEMLPYELTNFDLHIVNKILDSLKEEQQLRFNSYQAVGIFPQQPINLTQINASGQVQIQQFNIREICLAWEEEEERLKKGKQKVIDTNAKPDTDTK